jgi:hypothetical protein
MNDHAQKEKEYIRILTKQQQGGNDVALMAIRYLFTTLQLLLPSNALAVALVAAIRYVLYFTNIILLNLPVLPAAPPRRMATSFQREWADYDREYGIR